MNNYLWPHLLFTTITAILVIGNIYSTPYTHTLLLIQIVVQLATFMAVVFSE